MDSSKKRKTAKLIKKINALLQEENAEASVIIAIFCSGLAVIAQKEGLTIDEIQDHIFDAWI